MNNPKHAIIFGAGASHGHLPTNVPALGHTLIEEMIKFSNSQVYKEEFSSIGEISKSLDEILCEETKELFREDFELGMLELIEKKNGKLLTAFELIMAGYFSQFTSNKLDNKSDIQNSLYSDLANKLLELENIENLILISLNYDLILEKYFWISAVQLETKIGLKYSFRSFHIDEQTQDHPWLHLIKPHGSINFRSSITDSSVIPVNDLNTPISILKPRATNYQGFSLADTIHSNLLMAAYTNNKPFSEHSNYFACLRSDTIKTIRSLSSISFIGVRLHELNVLRDPFLNELIDAIPKNCITSYIGDCDSVRYLSKRGVVFPNHLGKTWAPEHNNAILDKFIIK